MKLDRRSHSIGSARRLYRAGRYSAIIVSVLLGLLIVLYVAGRLYWPTFLARKVDLETLLSGAAQQSVRFERIEPYWDGLNPGVRIYGASVHGDDSSAPSITVAEAQASVALLPLLWGRVELGRLVLNRPALALARFADGRIGVVGLPARPQTDGRGGWVLQQPRIVVHGGEIRWSDARDPDDVITLSNVEIRVRNSTDRHRLVVNADMPERICRACSVSVDISGNPMTGPWEGEISARAQGLNVTELPLILRERLPAELRGQMDMEIWSDWRDGRPQVVRGDVAVHGFRFPLGGERQPLALPEASANLHWYTDDGGWRLDLADTKVALTRGVWSPGRVRLTRGAAESALQIARLELDDVAAYVSGYQGEHPLLARLIGLRPSGVIEHLDVRVRGSADTPDGFSLSGNAIDLGFAARDRLPGVRGLTGRVSLKENSGEIDIDSTNVTLSAPTVWRAPIQASRASGRIRWRKGETAWHANGSDLKLKAEDGEGSGSVSVELPLDRSISPVVQLRVDFKNGNGANVGRYIPVSHLSSRAVSWIESSFLGGRVVSGHVIYQGAVRDFPFSEGKGRFEIRARVRDGVYRYLEGWAPLTQVEADVAVDGPNFRVTGRGRVGGVTARDVKVDVTRPQAGPGRLVQVRAQLDGTVAETLRVLRDVDSTKAARWQPYVREVAQAEGSGALDLDLRIPIRMETGNERTFAATYRFKNIALRQATGSGIEAATGFVKLSDGGLREAAVQGRLFGGPMTLTAAHNAGELRVNANGKLLLTEVLRGQRAFAEHVNGDVDWSFALQQLASGPQLQFDADLSAIRSRLPAPFAKTAASPEKLTVTTEQSRPDAVTLVVKAGSLLNGRLAFVHEPTWRLQKGRLDIGRPSTRPLPVNGFEVSLSADEIDVDRWLPLFSRGTGAGNASSEPATPIAAAFTADVKRLYVGNRHWGRLFAHVVPRGGEWRAVLDGDALAGEASIALAAKTPPKLRLDLAYLRLPESSDKGGELNDIKELKELPDPRRFPTIDLHALSFEYKQRKFGELVFAAAPSESAWRISKFALTRPEMRLLATGAWRVRSGERHETELNAEFESDNMGVTLDALGMPGQMDDGKVKLKTNLNWPSSPLKPDLAGVDGKVEVSAEKGRFLKVETGAVRLFGLFDLRSIGRYLTFDFSPAFGKGFVFDAIHGNIAVDKGNARTQDLVVRGPSLALGVNGRVGLAAEDYDLVLEASPKFGGTLALTSWGLLGPQVAAAVVAFQRLFRRQIEESTRITYLIKGPWDNPVITKVGKRAEQPSSDSPQVNP